MAMNDKTYRKLSGKNVSLFGTKRLWQGPDHLLWVETIYGLEHYKRFYFKDIQAIIIQRTDQHQYWNIVWGILALVFGIVAFTVSGTPYVSGFLTIFFLLCIVVNIYRGPGCTVYFQTAVQIQKVTSLCRLHTAQKILDNLKTFIESAQGPFDPSVRPEKSLRPLSGPSVQHEARMNVRENYQSKQPAETEPLNPLFHRILFSVLLAAGLCKATQLWVPNISLGLLDLIFNVGVMTLSAVALVRSYRQIKDSWLSKITWAALILSFLVGIVYYIVFMVVVIRNPSLNMNHWELLKQVFYTLMDDRPVIMGIKTGMMAIYILLGTIGFISLPKKS